MKKVIPLVLLLLALPLLGCHKEAPAAQGGMTRAPAAAQRGLDLPRLKEPARVPAQRVVHLLYTSNVDGEAEPCG